MLLRSNLIAAALSMLIGVALLASQTDTTKVLIAGTVTDPLRVPIEGAEVRVVGVELSTLSSPSGTFHLYAPRSKEILVQIRRPGYNAQLLKLGADWSGSIVLEPGSYRLPELLVTARNAKPVKYAETAKYDDYFKRLRSGFGEFVSREDIEQRAPMEAADILQGRAGIKVSKVQLGDYDGTIVAFARCNEYPPKINVYVDGRKLIPRTSPVSDEESTLSILSRGHERTQAQMNARNETRALVGEMLARINPSDIELIEIFRGPGELPPEFNDGNCGAISIWTRQGGR